MSTPTKSGSDTRTAARREAAGRILLIDDHLLFRAGLRLILSDGPHSLGAVSEASSITQAVSLPQEMDLVLLDIELPGISGLAGLALIQRRWPRAAIVMLSAQEDSAVMQKALAQGALAFVSKTASPEHIRRVAQQALRHELSAQALEAHAAPAAAKVATPNTPSTSSTQGALSARQLDVLELLGQGLSNKVIAHRLILSENTVRNHIVAILRHFNANTRTEAMLAAQLAGVIRLRGAALA